MRPTSVLARPVAGVLSLAALTLAGGAFSPAALPAQAASTPWCSSADLSSSYRASDAGAGHVYGWIVLRNTSDHSCRTGGYGGVSYVGDGNGTQIGAAAVRIDQDQVTQVVLAPGQRVRSALDETRAVNYPRQKCHRAHVDGFRIYVPDSTVSQYVVHPTTGCRATSVHLLHQKPYQRP